MIAILKLLLTSCSQEALPPLLPLASSTSPAAHGCYSTIPSEPPTQSGPPSDAPILTSPEATTPPCSFIPTPAVTYTDNQICDLGLPNHYCMFCGARFWYAERINKTRHTNHPLFPLCCQHGKVSLPLLKQTPDYLDQLFNINGGPISTHFRDNIRAYNAMFSFTSFGARLDPRMTNTSGPYSFIISGEIYHHIGSLLPPEGQRPKFSQLYVHDTADEVAERLSNFSSTKASLKPEIVQGLITMFNESNDLVKSFRRISEQLRDPATANLRLRITGPRIATDRRYDLPTGSEVAALIPGDFREDTDDRDIIIDHRSRGIQRITNLNPKFSALHFPVLFSHGEDGFHLGIKYNPLYTKANAHRQDVTDREFHCFRLQHRDNEGQSLMRGGKALQHYCVDAFSTIEQNRLLFLRLNQKLIRAELYSGLCDAFERGDLNGKNVGQSILPASYTGSPRYMKKLYLDAMAVCRTFGNPDLFITFTCNTQWPEIVEAFKQVVGTKSELKPDVVCRVYYMKVLALIHIIRQGQFFGPVLAAIYTVEFQKRGLPHIHLLVWLDHQSKLTSIESIDATISAEIPDPETDPLGYAAVTKCMMHGPCGSANPKAPCMQDGKCTKFFPKPFNSCTSFDQNGYVVYRRRDNGRTVEKNGCLLDNRYVVPYNRNLLVYAQGHINVENCHKGRLVKYLFKYVTKGPDRAIVVAETVPSAGSSLNTNSTGPSVPSTSNARPPRDEIQQYLDCRVVSSFEAIWRLFEYPLHYRTLTVVTLSVHLEHQQSVPYDENEPLEDVLERGSRRGTTLTAWFDLNRSDPAARCLPYAEIPEKYTFNSKPRTWTRRKKGFAIGRIVYIPPADDNDTYYLRILLTKIKGALGFEDLLTVNGVVCRNYQEACLAHGFLTADDERQAAITEVGQWAMPATLRAMFVALLRFSEVADPAALFESNWELMADDISYQPRHQSRLSHLQPPRDYLRDCVLRNIEGLLRVHSLSLDSFKLPHPTQADCPFLTNRLLMDHLDFDLPGQANLVDQMLPTLNYSQAAAYHTIMESVSASKGRFFFLYGHGGTGKTYLYSALIAKLRSKQEIVLVVASSGIAATLLPGGVTGHSRFKVPINVDSTSTCNVKRAVSQTLCDIMEVPLHGPDHIPFGGKTVLLGGDFRQIFPVITNAGKEETLDASITRSPLWSFYNVLQLTRNMRINEAVINSQPIFDGLTFPNWVLSIGNGTTPSTAALCESQTTWIRIPEVLLLPNEGSSDVSPIVQFVYDNFEDSYASVDYIQNRAVVTPTNDTVSQINAHVLAMVPGDEKCYYSSDSLCQESTDSDGLERLYPEEFLNSLSFNGIPEHVISLKLFMPIMLLRNLNPSAGLCNGTRLLVTYLGTKVIKGVIITGSFKGTVVAIPRIVLNANDHKWPFTMKRTQFPIRLCYAMTINKSQGQTVDKVGVFLPKPVFSHGQLYVAASRVRSADGLRFKIYPEHGVPHGYTKNIVHREVYADILQRD